MNDEVSRIYGYTCISKANSKFTFSRAARADAERLTGSLTFLEKKTSQYALPMGVGY